MARVGALLPGLLAAAVIGGVATVIATVAPVLGAPVLAVLLGLVTRTVIDRRWGGAGAGDAGGRSAGCHPGDAGRRGGSAVGGSAVGGSALGGSALGGSALGGSVLGAGSRFAGRHVLQAAVVVLGAGLSMRSVLRTGVASLPVMLGTLALCLAAAWLFGRLLRIPDPLRTLIGAGTGICGASAIAALRSVVAADEASVAYAVSTIVVYNIVATILFPPLGRLLGLGQHAFGLWAGTAVNDTSSVVATGYAYGPAAGRYAVTVKLTRALMIIPVVLGAAVAARRQPLGAGYPASGVPAPASASGVPARASGGDVARASGGDVARGAAGAGAWSGRAPLWRLVPPFLVLFLLAAAANSAGLVPAGWQGALARLSSWLIAVALAGVGLGVRVGELRRAGLRPLAFGGLLSLLVAGGSLALQALTAR